ncbi:hypothetical protein OROGR_007088 [Orobanche gracilis]
MMVVEANEGTSVTMDLFSAEDFDDDVVIDLEALWEVVGGHPDYPQDGRLEDLPFIDALKGGQTSAVLSTEDGLLEFGEDSMPYNFGGSESWRECLESESLQRSSKIGQGNGLFCTAAYDGLNNDLSNINDGNQAPFESLDHNGPFDVQSIGEVIHNQTSLDLNDPDIAPSAATSYSESSSFRGTNSVVHERYFSRISDINRDEDIVGTTGYSSLHTYMNEWKYPIHTVSNENRNDIFTGGTEVANIIGGISYGGPGHMSSTEGGKWIPSNSLSLISCDNNNLEPKGEREDFFFESRLTSFPGMADEIQVKNSAVVGHARCSVSENPPALLKVEINPLKMENQRLYSAPCDHDWRPLHQVSQNPGQLPAPSVKLETSSLNMENEMPNSSFVAHDGRPIHQVPENPGIPPTPSTKVEANALKMDNDMPNTYQGVQTSTAAQINIDDDCDLCILEDMSAPAHRNHIAVHGKLAAPSHFSTSRNAGAQTVTTHSRVKPNDELVIFRVALQDLTQPKSEATPPYGLLSVPLLKHQRIALSWMVNKEIKSACCSGGILADDQGLGKTVSTIALILTERPSASKGSEINGKQREAETFNLDDDDDGLSEAERSRVNVCPIYGSKYSPLAKGRPSGGTLIVCPTSVLRQWSEELHNKVTTEADLSVLVYYGSNRTKDPLELSKYDVVVTTYAIVSMEVPKQPVVSENKSQIDSPYKEFSSSRKRKLFETASDRNFSSSKKSRKAIDSDILENAYGPLAQVGWFRVVLDEAQSIKNHRTQVARACWGLRAKRRWCLSGTPIQNAIDDLYSYFRFLRYEPYAVFRTFCEQLKVPIHRNPRNGYKKLQAVLKTVMLRRTKDLGHFVQSAEAWGEFTFSKDRWQTTHSAKGCGGTGTFINGEPIINLPPKTIELRKVDFSMEERNFYCRLEADSRAQFAEYAAAGTVKQNYINILLMLLRLRQACDHPLLVKGFSSNSKLTSSIEMAKKLHREKQNFLLSCLEASLAICGICNDPPEDAVVTVCGHVFCNQCICEHLIGDGTQCPTKKCKTHLTMACVFSITTLRIALSDDPSVETTTRCTGSEVAEVSEPLSSMPPQDSAKIKAALDILLSLSIRNKCVSGSWNDDGILDMIRDPNNPDKVVPEKAIVFSQWTGMLDLLEVCLKDTSIQYRRLDGTMPVAARDRAVKDFNSVPQVSVMIMSLKAASLGLNMVVACNVLLLDLWWNPTTEDQAIDRAHRIGQTRPVSVYRLTVKDTVEDRILALQQRKRKMVASAFGENETGTRQTRLTVDDLKYLFRA